MRKRPQFQTKPFSLMRLIRLVCSRGIALTALSLVLTLLFLYRQHDQHAHADVGLVNEPSLLQLRDQLDSIPSHHPMPELPSLQTSSGYRMAAWLHDEGSLGWCNSALGIGSSDHKECKDAFPSCIISQVNPQITMDTFDSPFIVSWDNQRERKCDVATRGQLPLQDGTLPIQVSFILTPGPSHESDRGCARLILEIFITAKEVRSIEFSVYRLTTEKDPSWGRVKHEAPSATAKALQILRAYFRTAIVYQSGRVSKAVAIHKAAYAARGTFILFIGGTKMVVSVTPGWLTALLFTAQRMPSFGAAGSFHLDPRDRSVTEAGGLLFSDGLTTIYNKVSDARAKQMLFARRADFVSLNCMLMKRQVFMSLDGLDLASFKDSDETIFSEIDLSMSIRQHRLHVFFQPASIVSRSRDASDELEIAFSSGKANAVLRDNRNIFIKKWANVLQSKHLSRSSQSVEDQAHSQYHESLLWVINHVPIPFQDIGAARSDHLLRVLHHLGYDLVMQPIHERPTALNMALRFKGVDLRPASQDVDRWEVASSDVCIYGLIVVSGGWKMMERIARVLDQGCPSVIIIHDSPTMIKESIAWAARNSSTPRQYMTDESLAELASGMIKGLGENEARNPNCTILLLTSEIEAMVLARLNTSLKSIVVPHLVQEPARYWQELLEGVGDVSVAEFKRYSGGGRGIEEVRSHHIVGKKAMKLAMSKCLNRPMFLLIVLPARSLSNSVDPFERRSRQEEVNGQRLEKDVSRIERLMTRLWTLLVKEEERKMRVYILGLSKKEIASELITTMTSRPWFSQLSYLDLSDSNDQPRIEEAASFYSRAVAILGDEEGSLDAPDVALIGLTRGTPILMTSELSSRLYRLKDHVLLSTDVDNLSALILRMLRCEEPLWKELVDGGMRVGLEEMSRGEAHVREIAERLKTLISLCSSI